MDSLVNIQTILKKIKPDLVVKYNINSLGLFGSVVRKDFSEKSDVDILVDFTKPIGVEFIDLANELEFVLKRKVDLVSKTGVKAAYLKEIQPEIIYV